MPPEYSQFNTGALFADDPTVRTDQLFPQPVPSGSVRKPLRFTRANFADPATYTPVSGFLRSRDIMELDPDPTGERTEAWGARNGEHLPRSYVAGLNVFGRVMDRDKLNASEAGRQLLSIAEKNRAGDRRGFWEAVTDFSSSDLPFVGMVASVGGSVSDAVNVFDTLKALQDGMPVSDENLIKARLYLARQDYAASGSWGSKVGDIVRQAPGFMIEFGLSGKLAAVGRVAAVDAGIGGMHLAMSRGAKVLARESVEHEAEKIVTQTIGRTAGRAAVAEGFAGLAGTASEREVVEATAKRLFGFMKSTDAAHLYKGFSDDALMSMAKNRAQYEFGKMLSRRGGTVLSNGFHSFTQWLGQNVSRGLLDFGAYGTEEATTLFTRQSTAGRALADALGVFAIEAPIKGGVLMLPKKAVEQGVVAPAFGQDGRIVSDNALSLRATALMTGNRSLMDSAESIALGMDLLEYISENTGRGLKSLLAAGGIGLERFGVRGLVRPVATAISAAGRELPSEGLEAVTVGGKMRQFVQKVFGSRADYARRIAGQEAELVANRLGVEGAERAAVRSAVMTGNITGLRPELQQAIGSDLGRFVKETVSQAYDQGVKDLQYKSYARYAVAKWMQKHQVGPETVMNMFNQMGYDGVLGEMFEERYSDVVKGLLGLDARTDTAKLVPGAESSETASFLNNVKEAVKGLYPGWDQLTAEAVGFMFPMVTRGVAMRAMSAIGGQGELAELRSKLDVIDDAMRHNTVGEMTYADAQTAFEYARQADAKEVAGLRKRLAEFEAAGDAVQAEAVRKELETRETVAARRAERQKVFFDSVDEAARNAADSLIAVPLDTYGTLSDATLADRSPVLTAAEARQVLDAQKALGDFASQLARQIVEGQLPVEGESEGTFRKIARKLVGVAGFLATGDFSLAAVNPAQWTARDMGLSKNVVDSLRDGFRAELTRVRKSMPDTATTKEVLDEAQRRFDPRARQIMSANLAVHQLRSFSDGRLTEEAAAQWAASTVDTDGRQWYYTVDEHGQGAFYKLTEDGADVDRTTLTSLGTMLREHKAEIEDVKRKILSATVDIVTRRLTGADHGRNAVLAAVTLDRRSDLLDVAIYDAAMHMIGARDVIQRVSLDGRTPLKAVLDSRSVARVSDGVVDYIASKQKLDDVDGRALESVAQALRLKFDGTEGGLKARNEKIFRMAKLMRFNRREGVLYFSKEILGEDEEALRLSANGTSTLVAKRQADGSYAVDYGVKKDNPQERDIRTFGSVEELEKAMSADGYTQDEAHTVLTQAKLVESEDMFWMIRELGLAKEYRELLGEDRGETQLHPMLRHDKNGKLLPQDDVVDADGKVVQKGAETILREELAAAARGALPNASASDTLTHNLLYGENGYITLGEQLLARLGVHKDSTLQITGDFHEYTPSRYTYLMSAGRISPKSADTYVVIDPSINSDLTSGLVNAVLLNAYSGHGALLRDALGSAISDFVQDCRRIAQSALAEAEQNKDTELAYQLRQFLRTCCDDVDRVVEVKGKAVVKKGVGLSPLGFTILSSAFGLFRAREDATNPMLRALATIAPRVWGCTSFLGFSGLLNVTLGGNFLDTAVWSAKPGDKDYTDPGLTGAPYVMALASGNVSALRDAVKSALPAGLEYEQFLEAVMAQLAMQSKTGGPLITDQEKADLRAKARAAAAENARPEAHYTFLGGLVSTMKAAIDKGVTTSKTVTDFLASVMEAVANDPNTTTRQREAAARQLEYMQRRNKVDEREQAYAAKVNELSELQEKLKAAEGQVQALRQQLVALEQKAVAGEPVSEADRQNGQVALADATAELETATQNFEEKLQEVTGEEPPEGLKALNLGGDTKAGELDGVTADGVEEAEDDGDAAVVGEAMDVPTVFGSEAWQRRHDGFVTDGGTPREGTGRLTRRQAGLVAGTVLRSMATDGIDEGTFMSRLGQMFPHMREEERQDILDAFRRLDMKRISSAKSWDDAIRPGQHFGFQDDEDAEDERTSSDNFNERALAEYNSEALRDLSEGLKRVAPETGGSVAGFISMLRDELKTLGSDNALHDMLVDILAPQTVLGLKNLAQADAHHKSTLDELGFMDLPSRIDPLLTSSPKLAFLLSYMSSLPVNARTRFAGLCSGSVAATPMWVDDGIAKAISSAADGKVPDTLVTAAFDKLIGMRPAEVREIAKGLREAMATLDVTAHKKGASDAGAIAANAAKVAEVLARFFGTNNPLYSALTSSAAKAAWAGSGYRAALLESVSRTYRDQYDKKLGGVDLLATIVNALDSLGKHKNPITRVDVESTFIAAATMGGFANTGLKRAEVRANHTDPLLTFLNIYRAAIPRTMMKSRIDQMREQTVGSVVVAPRGMVPLLSRWLYQEGPGSFTDICRAQWPDVTDELLAECRQNGTWPDPERTPVCAKCLSSSLTPTEVYNACKVAYENNPKARAWVPIYSGDHSSFTLLQVPAGVSMRAVIEDRKRQLVEPGVTKEFDGHKVIWEKTKGKHRSFAWFDRKTDTIHVSAEDAKETFAQRAWEKPERSDPLPPGTISSLEDLIDFAVAHEAAHAKLPSTKVLPKSMDDSVDSVAQAMVKAIDDGQPDTAADKVFGWLESVVDWHDQKSTSTFEKALKNDGFDPDDNYFWVNAFSDADDDDTFRDGVVGLYRTMQLDASTDPDAFALDYEFSLEEGRAELSKLFAAIVRQYIKSAGKEIQQSPALPGLQSMVVDGYAGGSRDLARAINEAAYPGANSKYKDVPNARDIENQANALAIERMKSVRTQKASGKGFVNHSGEPPTYKSFAKAAYKAIGMDLMFTDTKRSAISSLEAQGTGLVGVDAQGNYGEHRVHILHSWAPGTKNDAFLGSTFMHGYGAKKIGEMSMDPDSNTKKVHVVGGAGRDLFFIKSLTISQDAGGRGKFREGTADRTVFDYLEKFRGRDSLSTDTLTDDDSYKIGPGNSKGLRAVNGGGDTTVMGYVFDRLVKRLYEQGILREGDDQDTMAKTFKAAYNKLTGDELDAAVGPIMVKDNARGMTSEMKLSEIMPGAMVNVFEGWSGPALDLSYQEDSAMAYTVANVAHKSNVPSDVGRSPRNYEVDALAMMRTLAAGGWLKTPGLRDQLHRLIGGWGALAASVYRMPSFRAAMIRMDENLQELMRNGEFVSGDGRFSGQFAVEEMTRQILAKVRQAANLPLRGIDAPLVAAGASIDDNGELVAHTTSRMERAMLKGSELFSDEEREFYGTNRRLALCNVNVSNNGFRYGWFLAEDAEATHEEAYRGGAAFNRAGSGSGGRRHACAIAWAAQRVHDATKLADSEPTDEHKAAALEARKYFASMFVDHHNTKISEYGDKYLSVFSVEDLFVPMNSDVEEFDYSAVQCEGQDLVFNAATGREHVFLGGTMFGLPRTPSYNGSMWLQTVRAGLPVTEVEIEDAPANGRKWRTGDDAMVSPDPYTNAILGCDHDGDKTKLYMLGVNGSGAVRYMDAPLPEGPMVDDPSADSNMENYINKCKAKKGLLERVRIDEDGNEVAAPEAEYTGSDAYLRISDNARKQVSNSFVRLLFSMSRQLPVDGVEDVSGTNEVRTVKRDAPAAAGNRPRAKFLGGVASSGTKAFPLAEGKKKPFLKANGLPEVIKPDGSGGTLGDPELAMALATSAKDAGDARGVMVSIARSLHVAWALGMYSGHDTKLKSPSSLLGPMDGTRWLRFMYHVDGLSNATFDDIKEQVCGRLGWTKGMMDAVLTELILHPTRIPVTDEEFEKALAGYAQDIKNKGSRYWMLRASRSDDEAMHTRLANMFTPDGRFTKAKFMATLGLEEAEILTEQGPKTIVVATEGNTIGHAVGAALARLPSVKAFIGMASRHGGRDSATGLLAYVVAQAVSDAGAMATDDAGKPRVVLGRSVDAETKARIVGKMQERLAEHAVELWTSRRLMLTSARSVGNSLNYLVADPGAPAAFRSRANAAEAYKTVDDNWIAGMPGALPKEIANLMHQSTLMMYDVAQDMQTVVSKALASAEKRYDLLSQTVARAESARVAAGRLLAKDTVSTFDLMGLQSNQQQIPLLAEMFSDGMDDVLADVLPGLTGAKLYKSFQLMAHRVAGDTGTMADMLPFIETLKQARSAATTGERADKVDSLLNTVVAPSYSPLPVAARVAIESMLSLELELMVTSTEFRDNVDNRAAAFLRTAPDTAFKNRQKLYGKVSADLVRIIPQFRANDSQALEKVRNMIDRIITGKAFGDKSSRLLPADADSKDVKSGKRLPWTRATSFTLSRENLINYVREYASVNGKVELKTWDDIEKLVTFPDPAVKRRVKYVWDALGDNPRSKVTPAVLFGAILPAYTLMTSRQNGTPNENSLSLLSMLPLRYYSALSRAEARRRASGDTIVPLMVGCQWAPEAFLTDNDRRASLPAVDEDFSEVPFEDPEALPGAADDLRGGPGLRGYRRAVRNSNTVDIFDPAFEAALGALRETSSRRLPPLKPTTSGHLTAGAYDRNTAKLALAMGALLGSWAKVEYNGGKTFTIRGDLRGDAGEGKAVSIVVDTAKDGLLQTDEDVERLAGSSAYATSLCTTVNLGITPAQFLLLPKDVRMGFVRKYGIGGASSNKVAWTVSAKGVATLVGRISVPAGGTTVYHEYFHQMMRMFESFNLFGIEDYRQLAEHFGEDPSGRHKFNEEKAAEAFRKWVEGNTDAKAKSVRGVFQKIMDFLKGLLEVLMQGFSYEERGTDTLFQMMVHGIAQPTTSRMKEAEMEAVTAASALQARLNLSKDLDQATVAEYVQSKYDATVRRQFALPKAGHKQTRAELEAQARMEAPALAGGHAVDLEGAEEHLGDGARKRMQAREKRVLQLLQNGGTTAQIAEQLAWLSNYRTQMAQAVGIPVDIVDPLQQTVEDDLSAGPVTDPVAEEISKVTSPLVNNNLFYRTANSIRQSLEDGLRGSRAWTDDLEYVVRQYAAPVAKSQAEENLRRQSLVHGLRRALAHVNPSAAKALSNKEIEDSLAYRAALVMHQHLEASYLNSKQARVAGGVARHASQYNVSAWVLSTDPVAPAAMVTAARDRIEELYNASPSGASKAELKLHLDQMDLLYSVVGDQTGLVQFRRDQGMTVLNEVIGTLRAGTLSDGVDENGALRDLRPVEPTDAGGDLTTDNPRSAEHLASFVQSHQDPAVQESLKLALTTAYQVAAMAKYYGDLDVHPAPAGDIAEAKRLARINGIPEHMSSAEFLGEHLVGDSNLVDNPAYVDYQCQSYFIGQNVDAWLRSMVRNGFGAHDGLGRMLSDEHFEYAGLINAITQKENWVAHMLGVSLEPGGYLLKALEQDGEYKMQNGEVVRKVGGKYVKFDNYGRQATSVSMTEEDLGRIDMWLKMCSAHANGQAEVVTGVDGLSFHKELSRRAEDYSFDAVSAKRDRHEHLNAVEWAVWRMTKQVPPHLRVRVHDRFVSAMLSALAVADETLGTQKSVQRSGQPLVYDAATYNSFVIGELVRARVLEGHQPKGAYHPGGQVRYEDAVLLVPCDYVDEEFRGSETRKKLVKAGRREEWLDRDFIVKEFMETWADTVKFVKRHPWLTHGDGKYFHTFGTALPFWRGSGVFMYNAVRSDRRSAPTPQDKLSVAERTMDRIMKSGRAGASLRSLARDLDAIDDADVVASFIGADHRAGQFIQDVVDGLYEAGERKAVETGVILPADATYADLARAFYQKARERVWAARSGLADGADTAELNRIIEYYEDSRLERGELFGGSMGFRDTDMFRMHGTLPANYEIGHKVHKCIDGVTNAMMSRATLANLLLTPEGSTGAPVYYADPSRLAAEASGLPDSFWGNLAEWWQKHNDEDDKAIKIGQVYDPAKSGVENAKAVYEAIRQKNQIQGKPRKAQIGELGYTELGGDDSQLVSVDHWLVLDGNGEDFLNATAGGEAMGYLRHYIEAGKSLGFGGPKVRAAIQRALSYSKSLSVSFSFFFPIATRWESPMGAVGAMSTIGSNWKTVGDWMKEHPDAANKIRGLFGGKAWITHDYIGMRDIVQMMDSNDPFLAEMYSWAAALGITVSTSVTNPMEPDKTILLKDIRRMKEYIRSSMGADAAGNFARMMDALMVRQGDKAFNYVLNATKLAVVAQMCMKLRHQAKATGKAFDPVRDLKKYSRYINAEIGGIDPMQFAWAHPKAQSLMNTALFSWQWTLGAWQAGGGSVITDLLAGGHTMTNKERAYFAGRWMRMFLGVMIGVPALFQVVVLALAKAMGGGDDDDHWGTWQNEDKARWSAFDLTPLLKAIARFDETKLGGVLRRYKENGRGGSILAGAAAGAAMGGLGVGGMFNTSSGSLLTGAMGGLLGAGVGAVAPSLIPLYTGKDTANSTRRRRYYMHFGKQGWEFFRWFDDAKAQIFSKQSMVLQRLEEGIIGRSLGYIERSLPWEEMGQFERWLSPTTDSALFNIAEAFLSFSVSGMNRNGDAGVLPIFGPVQMGVSQTAVQKRLVARLEKWAANDRAGYRFGRKPAGKGKYAGKPYQLVTDILQDARRNGLDPDEQLYTACGQVMRGYYGKLFAALPERPDDDYDAREVSRILRALLRLGSKRSGALTALKDRYKTSGHEWKTLPPEQRQRVREILDEGFGTPFDY